MKKADVINALKELGVTEIEGLDYNELRSLLKEKEDEQGGQEDAGAKEQEGATSKTVVGEAKPEAPSNDGAVKADNDEPLIGYEYQLRLNESKIINIHPNANRVVILNLGEGDLYTDVVAVSFHPDARLAPGESREFTGAKNVFLRSMSRPVALIEQFVN